MLPFFRSPFVLIFSLLVVAQGAATYLLDSRHERALTVRPLAELSKQIGSWQMVKEWPMEPEVQAVLQADDTTSRFYTTPGEPYGVALFIAFFKSQRSGVAPHSPKNCLPGAGWVQEHSSIIKINIPGRPEPIEANYDVVQKGDQKSVVVYWYQSHGRVVASEYTAKFWVVADAMRYNRTDTALVKLTVAVGPNGTEVATKQALQFAQDFFQPVSAILPQ